jgi:hypothetical protein
MPMTKEESKIEYRKAQMEYTGAVSRYIDAKSNPSLSLSVVLSAGRMLNVASDKLADAGIKMIDAV